MNFGRLPHIQPQAIETGRTKFIMRFLRIIPERSTDERHQWKQLEYCLSKTSKIE